MLSKVEFTQTKRLENSPFSKGDVSEVGSSGPGIFCNGDPITIRIAPPFKPPTKRTRRYLRRPLDDLPVFPEPEDACGANKELT
jgi:hypothetical protein